MYNTLGTCKRFQKKIKCKLSCKETSFAADFWSPHAAG